MKLNTRTNSQSEIRTIEHTTAQSIKHKNTCTVEQEYQLISFLIEVAHQEVPVIQANIFLIN